MAPVHARIRASLHCVTAIVRFHTTPTSRATRASRCCCFCGRMPPKRGPLWRGEQVEGQPEGARAGSARGRCAHKDVRSAPPGTCSRTRRAGCPESAPPGVCFFGDFLCTSKESYPLARRASGSLALKNKKHAMSSKNGTARRQPHAKPRPSPGAARHPLPVGEGMSSRWERERALLSRAPRRGASATRTSRPATRAAQ